MRRRDHTIILSMVLLMHCSSVSAQYTDGDEKQLLEIGKKIYQKGVKSDNTQVQAILAGDIGASGEQIACINCHQRSGLGTLESSVISWRVSGKELFQPRRRSGAWSSTQVLQDQEPGSGSLPKNFDSGDDRPAYTDMTLAKAIREGVDSSGNNLNNVMPRYALSDNDMAALNAYLKSLSADYSPGVDETTIRFATIISDKADPVDVAAMLNVLKKLISNHNSQTRPYVKRRVSGPFYRSEMNTAYRYLALDIWRLNGDRQTWSAQLQEYYEKKPVFALLGGLIEGHWQSIHQFSEKNQIPAIFPITDLPVISDQDWYTLYFSKGAYQQGEATARYLNTLDLDENVQVVQVFSDSNSSKRYAKGFEMFWQENTSVRLIDHEFKTVEQLRQTVLNKAKTKTTVWLLWLDDKKALAQVSDFLGAQPGNDDLYLSSWDLFKANPETINPRIAQQLYLSFSQALPHESAHKKARLKQWLKISGIESRNLVIEDKMYFLGWMLSAVLKNMRNDFYRDYFLENFEMMREQNRAIAHFPHVTFAPGQRYIAKGSYIVQHDRLKNDIKKISDWSVY